MIIETVVETAFTYEGQPDGGRVTVVDPYDGCQLHCPYCFQLNDPDWNKDIYVKTNLPEALATQLADWPATDALYFGSRCDPYMPLEADYRLTRRCLEVLQHGTHPVFITTKADHGLILEDLDLFQGYAPPLTVLMGLAHPAQAGKGAANANIATANALQERGVTVWAFITPVLPHITDVDAMIGALHPDIPVYLDKLRVMTAGGQDRRVWDYVARHYPHLKERYRAILYQGDESYYQEMVRAYRDDPRVTFVFA